MKVQSASLVFALLAATWALGQAEVNLANGAVIQGRVIEDDGEKIKVALVAEGGTGATAIYRYEQLAPQTIYRLKFNKTERDDVKGQMDLAAYALDNGVFPSARLSYDLAKKANEKKKAGMDQDLAKLYARAPKVCLEWARKAVDTKQYLSAERILSKICALFPDAEEAVTAAKMIEEIASADRLADARKTSRTRRVARASRPRRPRLPR